MPLYLEARQTEIWKFSKNCGARENIEAALVKMAYFRQAKVEKKALELYSKALEPLDMRAFQVAMAVLSERPREEGEPAFPSFGMILEVMEEARERFTTPRKPKLNTLPVTEGMKQLEAGK